MTRNRLRRAFKLSFADYLANLLTLPGCFWLRKIEQGRGKGFEDMLESAATQSIPHWKFWFLSLIKISASTSADQLWFSRPPITSRTCRRHVLRPRLRRLRRAVCTGRPRTARALAPLQSEAATERFTISMNKVSEKELQGCFWSYYTWLVSTRKFAPHTALATLKEAPKFLTAIDRHCSNPGLQWYARLHIASE